MKTQLMVSLQLKHFIDNKSVEALLNGEEVSPAVK